MIALLDRREDGYHVVYHLEGEKEVHDEAGPFDDEFDALSAMERSISWSEGL